MASEQKDSPKENPIEAYATLINKQILQNTKDIYRLKRKVAALGKLLEAERVPPEILAERIQTRNDTIARAEDIWGTGRPYDRLYADASKGLYPRGNQLGRRYIIPQDFGLKSWNFSKPAEYTLKPTPETQVADVMRLGRHQILDHHIVDEEAFIIIHGFKYKPLEGPPKLQSLEHRWSGVTIPPMSISFANARLVGGYHTLNLEVPPVLPPKSMIDLTAFFDDLAPHEYQLGIFGEVVGRRRYLYQNPQDLLKDR